MIRFFFKESSCITFLVGRQSVRQKKLREGRLVLRHGLWAQHVMVGKVWWPEPGAFGHSASTIRKPRETLVGALMTFFSSCSVELSSWNDATLIQGGSSHFS